MRCWPWVNYPIIPRRPVEDGSGRAGDLGRLSGSGAIQGDPQAAHGGDAEAGAGPGGATSTAGESGERPVPV